MGTSGVSSSCQAVGVDMKRRLFFLFEALHFSNGFAILGDPGGVTGFEGGRGFWRIPSGWGEIRSPKSVRRRSSLYIEILTACHRNCDLIPLSSIQRDMYIGAARIPRFKVAAIKINAGRNECSHRRWGYSVAANHKRFEKRIGYHCDKHQNGRSSRKMKAGFGVQTNGSRCHWIV